jgi:uracil-DNA glycosylase family 4
MEYDDDVREIFDLARRAFCCQADLGHKEIILEAHLSNPTPPDDQADSSAHEEQSPFDRMIMAAAHKPSSSDTGTQTSLLEDESSDDDDLGEPHYSTLEEHRRSIANCDKCPLGKTRSKLVYGVGNPKADIMFIGEAPGREEDLQGEPFVGRAGKLLDKILAAMGFNRDDVYIANVLKCRPPENRDPQPEEMKACMPYLLEQIRLIRPKFIVALGRIAAHALLDTNAPLGKLRGQWHQFHGIPLIVTYHPAALLRSPQYKRPTWEDMQVLMAEYERVNQDK